MIIRLHYAPLILTKDIQYYEFETLEDVKKFILENVCSTKIIVDKVVLINIDDEIFITDNFTWDYPLQNFVEFLCDMYDAMPFINIYLQEYYSYEEAYEVALTMKEENPMCYKRNIPLSKN